MCINITVNKRNIQRLRVCRNEVYFPPTSSGFTDIRPLRGRSHFFINLNY